MRYARVSMFHFVTPCDGDGEPMSCHDIRVDFARTPSGRWTRYYFCFEEWELVVKKFEPGSVIFPTTTWRIPLEVDPLMVVFEVLGIRAQLRPGGLWTRRRSVWTSVEEIDGRLNRRWT